VWGWGAFGAHGIDAALYSGTKCYFFSGKEYIRVTRGEVGAGTVDPGYPKPISVWGWGSFGAKGIDAALNSGPKDYFFSGKEYIRVTRGDSGPGRLIPVIRNPFRFGVGAASEPMESMPRFTADPSATFSQAGSTFA